MDILIRGVVIDFYLSEHSSSCPSLPIPFSLFSPSRSLFPFHPLLSHAPLPPLPFPIPLISPQPLPSLPTPTSLSPFPTTPSFPSLRKLEVSPLNPARGSGERCKCKLHQQDLGQSPSRNRIWCILALKCYIKCQRKNCLC